MSKSTPDTEIVFRDLTKDAKKIRHQNKNPDALRRRFHSFVLHSQQLTDMMRKEYKNETGENWEASQFPGWTAITNLVKELRNTDQHQMPITIRLVQSQFYDGIETTTDDAGNKVERPVQLEVQLGFTREVGLKKKLPGRFDVADMAGGNQEMMVPSRFDSKFQVEARTPEVEKLLEAAGTNDIHEITQQAYETLAAYYGFYKEKLETSRKQLGK